MLRLAKPMFLTLILHFAKEILKDIKKKLEIQVIFSLLLATNRY